MRLFVMRHFNTWAVLFCLFCFAALSDMPAQDSDVFAHPLSAETLPRYTAVCAELAGHPLVKGSFEQTKTLPRLDRSLVSSGVFIIAAELGMVWETRSPFPSTVTMGRDFMIQSTPGGAKSKVDARGNGIFMSIADTMSALFTGDAARLRRQFDNYFMETREQGGTVWTIGLVPREKAVRSFAERILLSGDSGAGKDTLIRSVTLHTPDGGSVRYALSGHRFPVALEADEKALFSFE
jgi:hypothetical protein